VKGDKPRNSKYIEPDSQPEHRFRRVRIQGVPKWGCKCRPSREKDRIKSQGPGVGVKKKHGGRSVPCSTEADNQENIRRDGRVGPKAVTAPGLEDKHTGRSSLRECNALKENPNPSRRPLGGKTQKRKKKFSGKSVGKNLQPLLVPYTDVKRTLEKNQPFLYLKRGIGHYKARKTDMANSGYWEG